MFKSYLTAIVLVLFMSGCSTKDHILFQDSDQSTVNNKKVSYSPSISYSNKIAPRDRISVEVFNGQKSISSDNVSQNHAGYIVSEKGSVYLPLVGHVQLAGLSESEASEHLTKVYSEYLKFPFVKLDILNQRVYVIGEVQKPGIVPVNNEILNFFEALAQSGDFTEYANRTDVKIVTYVDGKPHIRSVDMTSTGSIHMANLILKPNDIVYIPPRNIKMYNTYLKETGPLLNTINSLLTPFVNIKYLRD
ncbi:MAG: polysaccharide biosynthesis/export family protein [Sulfurovaceae bacterium]